MQLSSFYRFGLAALGAVLVSGCLSPADPERLLAEARELWRPEGGGERRLVLRLAGARGYGPCSRPDAGDGLAAAACGGAATGAVDVGRWTRLTSRIDRALADGPSAAAHHARALARLLAASKASALRRCQEDLERALELSATAAAHNDLAVVLRLRAEREDRPEALLHALDQVLRAAAVEASAEARFNLALLLTEAGLRHRAEGAWREVAATEGAPAWAAEAEDALAGLGRPHPCAERATLLEACLDGDCAAVASTPECRETTALFLRDRLLPAWSAAQLAGDGDRAAALLEAGAGLGAWAGPEPGELPGLVGELRAARGDASTLAERAEAFDAWSDGRTALNSGAIERGRARLAEARSRVPADSALALLVDFELARAVYMQAADYRAARRAFADFERRIPAVGHRRLRGLVARFRGLGDGSLGLFDAARANLAAALDHLAASSSELSLGFVYSSLTESSFRSGAAHDGWSTWLRGIRGTGAAVRLDVAYNLVDVAFVELHRQGLDRAGSELAGELVALAELHGGVNYRYQAHLRQATAHAALGDHAAALAEFGRAGTWAAAIEDPALGRRALADVALFEAESRAQAEPADAVEMLGRSLEVHLESEHGFFVPRMLATRAAAYRRLGDLERARADLAAAASEIERELAGLSPRDLRIGFLDDRRRVFDRLLELEVEARADPETSLEVAERGRLGAARRPADLRSADPGSPELCRIHYRVLPDRLLLWASAGGGPDLVAVPVTSARLESLTREALGGLTARDREALEPAASDLYDLLLRPAGACLAGSDGLLLSPDGFLYAVPFAALRDRRTGRLLVEERPYRLLAAVDRIAPRPPAARPRAVTLASPRAPASLDPGLAPLRTAAAEAERVAGLYPGGRLLSDSGLARAALVGELEDASVFHFAGHAVTNFLYPLRSALVLGEGEDDVLSAADLAGLRLGGLELAFLSSCQALYGPASASAGALSLAGAFLEAGARAVVASVTDVDDALTAELSAGFHRRFAAGVEASEALRRAQIELSELTGGPHPAWAGYSLIGEEVRLEGKNDRRSVSRSEGE